MRVVLIDELDALVTSKQTLLYNLFNWPCSQNSKLLLISIANTQNLPEQLQAKITSRIGNTRIVYQPYTIQQIRTIIESRLQDVDLFDQMSITLISKKVAKFSGDIRRALQVTKRAVEIGREEFKLTKKFKRIGTNEVLAAFNEF